MWPGVYYSTCLWSHDHEWVKDVHLTHEGCHNSCHTGKQNWCVWTNEWRGSAVLCYTLLQSSELLTWILNPRPQTCTENKFCHDASHVSWGLEWEINPSTSILYETLDNTFKGKSERYICYCRHHEDQWGQRYGFKWSASHPRCFTLMERTPGSLLIEGSVGARASWAILENRRISSPHGQKSNHDSLVTQPMV